MAGYPNLVAEMGRYSISKNELMAAAGVKSQRTIVSWLNGKTKPNYDQMKHIQEQLFPGMRIEYLFSAEPIPAAGLNSIIYDK